MRADNFPSRKVASCALTEHSIEVVDEVSEQPAFQYLCTFQTGLAWRATSLNS